ncbi:hypothetical protein [Flavobacterium soyangense]|uniref:Uncharacterized protein n=1 Tax=Flavobacterium soyangense TaxID=2023265 RepID=A0A930Y0Q8_9FLAO|nr:hypothetical protein [Flavobacterium soyangense]MBF2708679.1 hypothetical protein [Flavobacterium soyangense]
MNKNKIKETSTWSTKKQFGLTWTMYTLVAVSIGAFWHAKWFERQYKEFNFITASEINVPLALTSMLLLGFISTYFFSNIYKPNNGNFGAIKTAIIVLLVPRMVVAFANAAEQDVNGKGLNLILFEFGLYLIMSIVWGFISSKIYNR